MLSTDLDITSVLHKYFPQIAERNLQAEIAEVGTVLQFAAGEIIMDYGSYIKMVPLILEGSIRVSREDDHDGREILLYFLNGGDTCSMSFSCCLMHKRSAIRTEALEDTLLIGIPVKYVDAWMSKYTSWKNFVMQSYDNRMHELIKVIDNIAFANLDTRLKEYLQARKKSIGSAIIHATHKEIAADMNASREAISRMLKKLEQLGELELGRNEIKVL